METNLIRIIKSFTTDENYPPIVVFNTEELIKLNPIQIKNLRLVVEDLKRALEVELNQMKGIK